MRRSRSAVSSARLALASVGTAVAVGVVCAVGLFSLGNASSLARVAVSRQLSIVDDAAAMRELLYQKGFVAQYLLTGDPALLAELESAKPSFEAWLARAQTTLADRDAQAVLDEIEREYVAIVRTRDRSIALHDAGQLEAAKAELALNRARDQRVRALFQQFQRVTRADAERTLTRSEASVRRLARVLVGTSLVGAVASLLVGFLWARRITKPIYELQVQVESAAERTRIKLAPGGVGLESLGDHVGALVEKLEESDAALAEHRRRLIQSEKLSAVGELAAKLAHEVLNPLAGMKAAVQLLGRQGSAVPGGAAVIETAEALNREITRVEGLVRRLVNFARPLAPRVEVATVGSLLDAAVEAAQPALTRHGVSVNRREQPDLPPLEVDPLLLTQALSNLLVNAAQAMGAAGGRIDLEATRAVVLGRDEIAIRVADGGPGLSDEQQRDLFKPFFTTKPDGHGLGLAISQNILLEHGGRIIAGNRPAAEGRGAVFEVQLPILR